jgi:hypothetical protein
VLRRSRFSGERVYIATCGERAVLYIHESSSTLMRNIGHSYCANILIQQWVVYYI